MVVVSSLAVAGFLLAAAEAPVAAAHLRLDVSVSQSSLSEGLPDWREQSVALSRAFTHGWAGAVRVESLERFDREDVYAEIRIDRTLATAAFYIAAGGAPDADFRPEAALKAGGEIALGRSANGVHLLVDGDVSRFATGDVYAMKLGFAQSSSTRALGYEVRAIAVSEAGGPVLAGYVLQARAPLTRRASLRIGYADAPETSEGVVVRVQGANAGLLLDVSDRWLLRVDGLHEDRGAYTRSEIAVGAALRF